MDDCILAVNFPWLIKWLSLVGGVYCHRGLDQNAPNEFGASCALIQSLIPKD